TTCLEAEIYPTHRRARFAYYITLNRSYRVLLLKIPPIKGGKAPQALGGVSVAATPGTSYRDIPLAFPHGNAVPLQRENILNLRGAALGGMSGSSENPLSGGERRLRSEERRVG